MKAAFRATGLLLALPAATLAAETLGGWDHWAAFRDGDSCRATSRPVSRRGDLDGAFLGIASWPARGIRARLHARLSRVRAPGAPVRLTIGPRWAWLTGAGRDAWARAGADAAIVAAMRGGAVLRIESRDAGGRPFADTYRLAGAATAVDAAAIACTPR